MSDASGAGDPAATPAESSSTTELEPSETNEPTETIESLKARLAVATAESRKHEQRAKSADEKAKANAAAAQEYQKLQRSQMSEHEKAIEKARLDGAAAERRELSGELVAMALRAAAGGRLEKAVVDSLAGSIDPTRFLGDDGKVNTPEIEALVDGLVPPPPPEAEDVPVARSLFPEIGGQGQRVVALNGSNLLDDLKAAVQRG